LKGQDNKWMDIVLWEDRQSASTGMQQLVESKECVNYFSCMLNEDHTNPETGVSLWEAVEVALPSQC
jgi:hypothetical protein